MRSRAIGRAAACCAVAVLAACGGAEHPGPSGGNPGAPLVPPPLVTSRTSPGEMPPGHPPVDPTGPGAIAPLRSGTGTGAAGMTWDVPEGWIEEQPSSSMRRAQYRVPGPGGDGEFVVFYFGPGQGGDPMSNAVRWAGQFRQPDGRSSTEVLSTEEIDVRGTPVMIVEVTGTYANLMVNDTGMIKFEYVSIQKEDDGFNYVPLRVFTVNLETDEICEDDLGCLFDDAANISRGGVAGVARVL